MSTDYDSDMGVLDLTQSLMVKIDNDEIADVIRGEIPCTSAGDPYRFGILCLDQSGNPITLSTDMDYQTLMVDHGLPPLFLPGNVNNGKSGVRCLRCGQLIKSDPIQMFRDWRTNEFHDLGGIPEEGAAKPYPDGPYDVGPECADVLRKRARYFLTRVKNISSELKG